jgi:hypothetical protein
MLEVSVLILCILLITSFVFVIKLYSEVSSLRNKNNKLKENVEKVEDLTSVKIGDKALLPDYGLTYTTNNLDFKVDYEVEILEVSVDQVKVKAISFTSHDNFAKDPANKQAIIDFIKNTWVVKNKVQLIVNDQMRREKKLEQLGIK